jgi:hypothetical protein
LAIQKASSSGIANWQKYNSAAVGNRSIFAENFGIFALSESGSISAAAYDQNGSLWLAWGSNIAKLDSSYEISFSRAGDTSSSNPQGMSFDSSGNAIVYLYTGDRTVKANATTGAVLNTLVLNSQTYGLSRSGNRSPPSPSGKIFIHGYYNPGGVLDGQVIAINEANTAVASNTTWRFNSDTRMDGGVAESSSGTFYAAGSAYTASEWNPSLVKINANGSIAWSRLVGKPGDLTYTEGKSVDVDNAGNAIMTQRNVGNELRAIVKLDTNGSFVWAKAIDPSNTLSNGVLNSVVVNRSTGESYAYLYSSTNGGYLIKFDSSGNVVWQRSFNTTSGNAFIDSNSILLRLSPDGSTIALIAYARFFGTVTPTFLLYPTDGSVTGSATLNYSQVVIAASSITVQNASGIQSHGSASTPSSNSTSYTSSSYTSTAGSYALEKEYF